MGQRFSAIGMHDEQGALSLSGLLAVIDGVLIRLKFGGASAECVHHWSLL